ncbi:hypothetical protein [Victivallis sp. Marseille-Q1083]|uniref:hypothetical protein n=1 Tax=Victivallis sp. Marseille-Q1083 TaxID=2717288 RepID=UPI00158BF72D|nr:hypothetical protein [Victivallis sp. Marseille-Q1083]
MSKRLIVGIAVCRRWVPARLYSTFCTCSRIFSSSALKMLLCFEDGNGGVRVVRLPVE